MKQSVPFVILLIIFIVAYFALFGEEGFRQLEKRQALRANQEFENQKLEESVKTLKKEVWQLKNDPKTIEKTVRNNYALAKPNEKIFFFKSN